VAQVFLYSKSSQPLEYQAGQYVKIVHTDKSTSPFSLANAPNNSGELEMHLLFLKENKKAWGIMEGIKEKKNLVLRGPYGQCTAKQLAKDKPIIFIARGTGFSPIKAVIEDLVQQPSLPAIHFYWSVPGWRDIYLRDLIHHWVESLRDFHFTAVLTREVVPEARNIKYGAVQEIIMQDYPDLAGRQVYMSGPEDMVYPALEAFQKRGLARENFLSDVFDYQP